LNLKWKRAGRGALLTLAAAVLIGVSTDFRGTPRFDGAGYALLGQSILTGQGYREIARPGMPPHDHFPPGYPLVLASLWSLTGRSVLAAHLLSYACTVAAVWLGWQWFLRLESRTEAVLLGLALAVNWSWVLIGAAIRSEPLYLVLSLAVLNLARHKGLRVSVLLGLLLGCCVLTRHVGASLALAILIDRGLSRRWREATAIALSSALVVAPWVVWLVSVKRNSQASHLGLNGLGQRVASQALFYARRIPDSLTGPFVEVATVFGQSRAVSIVATAGAIVVSGVILFGLVRTLRSPRRRLAGLVPLVTLPLLLVWPFTEAGRFLIPLVPFLLVGANDGLRAVVGFVRRGRYSRSVVPFLIVFAALPYSLYNLSPSRFEARSREHADFDAACSWISREANRPGLVLARHPGEVFWQTGRQATEPAGELDALEHQIQAAHIAYLVVDPDRYANAPTTPLARLVAERPGAVRKVFDGPVSVYEVQPR
jgi:hypothetical protein